MSPLAGRSSFDKDIISTVRLLEHLQFFKPLPRPITASYYYVLVQSTPLIHMAMFVLPHYPDVVPSSIST